MLVAYHLKKKNHRDYVLPLRYLKLKYRGHDGKLFKRDFCGEMMDKYSDLKLVDYGFGYRRDPVFQQDDMTWFLLEK